MLDKAARIEKNRASLDRFINKNKTFESDPDKVLKSFNTWAFKREQPSDPELLRKVVEGCVKEGRPVPLFLYWGKGPRETIAPPDVRCMDFLDLMCQRIAAAHQPGAHITLCFTDTHARLNGHSEHSMESYFRAIDEVAQARGMSSTFLSELVAAIEGQLTGVEPLDPVVLADLEKCARKWYRGEGGAEEGARKYFRMNLVERRAVEHAYPHSVFVTFNGGAYRAIFPPNLPVFYMYSLRKGNSMKPWFLDSDGQPFNRTESIAA